MALRHSDACNLIRLALSELGGVSVPYTVGRFRPLDSERVIKVGVDGVSDVLACVKGRMVCVEIKVGRDTQKPEQRRFQTAVEHAGGVYILARFNNQEDGVATLKRLLLTQPDGDQ